MPHLARSNSRKSISLGKLLNYILFALVAAATILGASLHTEFGYLSMCAVAWFSFFALAVVRDYSCGQYVYWTSQIFMVALTVVCCQGGKLGELGRAILLGIIPVFSAYAMWEFYKKLKYGNVLASYTNLLKS